MAQCNTVGAWVEFLRDILVDEDDVTWPLSQKVNNISMAMAAIGEARPDAFTETIEVDVVAGQFQKLPKSTIAIIGDIYPLCVDTQGKVVSAGAPSQKADESVTRAFSFYDGGRCLGSNASTSTSSVASNASTALPVKSSCDSWAMKGHSFDARNPTQLIVLPPVPDGVTSKIRVTVQQCAPCYTVNDLETSVICRHKPELLEYLLYLHHQKEQESELALRRASDNANRYMTLLGFAYKKQSQFASGYFLGAQGKGDPAVLRPN
jgi:hypothetical protein